MIGFNSFSNTSGLACFTVSAQSQAGGLSTEWESSRKATDATTSASGVRVTEKSADRRLDRGELEHAKPAARADARGVLKATARHFHDITADIYRYVVRSGSWTKSAPVTVK
jgi:hypothetical protein